MHWTPPAIGIGSGHSKLSTLFAKLFGAGLLLIGFVCSAFGQAAVAQETAQEDLRLVRARAIRQAVAAVADSVVMVELIGVKQTPGSEVSGDAPTVAVAVDDDGHFIASSLTVKGEPTSILLVAPDGRRVVATVVAQDYSRQLVLLKAQEKLAIPVLPLSDTQPIVGQTVIAIGRHSAGQSPAVSSGILSATDRNWGLALQTDARVSSAFYGGPLVDLRGRVLGVIVPMVPDGGAEEETGWYDSGVAFAIGSPAINERLQTMIQGKDIRPGLMGIVAKERDPYVESTGIAAVRPRSPADRAGIEAGDQVASVDSIPVRSHREIKQILGAKDAGTAIDIELKRGDDLIKKSVTLAESIPTLTPQRLGITAAVQTGEAPESNPALTVTGVVRGLAADGKLLAGDRIESIDGNEVADLESLRRRVFAADPEKPLTVKVIRDGQPQEVKIQTASITSIKQDAIPDSLRLASDAENAEKIQWSTEDYDMPDISNPAVLIAPKKKQGDEKDATAGGDSLGLLIVMADPGEEDLKKIAATWAEAAQSLGVVVCVVGPANADRWTPEEIDAPQRIAAAIRQNYAIDASMQAIAGAGKGPGGSIALATALLRGGTFSGLSVSPEIRPPAVRLRENDPAAPLQMLIPNSDDEESAGWIGSLQKVGYPVLRTAGDATTLIQWVRTLSII
jgi:S1-C subfamily serine protease